MRVVFIGASSFGLKCLESIYQLPGISIVGLITNQRTFRISYSEKPVNNVLHADFVAWASNHALPCFEMARTMRDVFLNAWVRSLEPQLFVVVGWYHMVPKSLREIAPAYGLHASLLPDYSGGAPLVWAIINGETKTGITLFQMDDGVDSGPIVAQAEEPIYADDTIATLYSRIEERGLELLSHALPALAEGSASLRAQAETDRRIMPQRNPEDGRIDWLADGAYLDRFVRAQTRPYPGAFAQLGGVRVTVWAAHSIASDRAGAPAGSIISYGGVVGVVCGKGCLMLDELEIDGRVLKGCDLVSVLRLGDCFTKCAKKTT